MRGDPRVNDAFPIDVCSVVLSQRVTPESSIAKLFAHRNHKSVGTARSALRAYQEIPRKTLSHRINSADPRSLIQTEKHRWRPLAISLSVILKDLNLRWRVRPAIHKVLVKIGFMTKGKAPRVARYHR